MITERRVFQAKVAQAGAVVAKIKEFQELTKNTGWPAGRVYTDLVSGHTDRVAWEADLGSLGELESTQQSIMQSPASQRLFAKWFGELTPLIEGATVELWTREDTATSSSASRTGARGRAPARRR